MGFVPICASVVDGEIVPSIPEFGVHTFKVRMNPKTRAKEMMALYTGEATNMYFSGHMSADVDTGVKIFLFGAESPNATTGHLQSRCMSLLSSYHMFTQARRQQGLANAHNCAIPYATSMVSTPAVINRYTTDSFIDKWSAAAFQENESAISRSITTSYTDHLNRMSEKFTARSGEENSPDSSWMMPYFLTTDEIMRRSFPLPPTQKMEHLPYAKFDGDVVAAEHVFEVKAANALMVPYELFKPADRTVGTSQTVVEQFSHTVISMAHDYTKFAKAVYIGIYANVIALKRCLDVIRKAEYEIEITNEDGKFVDELYTDITSGSGVESSETYDSVTIEDTRDNKKLKEEQFTLSAAKLVGDDIIFNVPMVSSVERILELLRDGMLDWKEAKPLLSGCLGINEEKFIDAWLPEAERLANISAETELAVARVNATAAAATAKNEEGSWKRKQLATETKSHK